MSDDWARKLRGSHIEDFFPIYMIGAILLIATYICVRNPSNPSFDGPTIHNGHAYFVLKYGYQSQTVIHDPDCPKCSERNK